MPHKLLFGLAAAQTGTQTFSSAGTFSWTAPTGVTSVTVTGRGGSNSTAWTTATAYFYLTTGPFYNLGTSSGKTSIGSSLTYEAVKSQANTRLLQFTGVTTDSAGENVNHTYDEYYYYTGEGWFKETDGSTRLYRRTGTVGSAGGLFSNSGTVPTSGASFSLQSNATNLEANIPISGGNSSALGANFIAGQAQSTVTKTAVAGQTYSIVVGANEGSTVSFITLSW